MRQLGVSNASILGGLSDVSSLKSELFIRDAAGSSSFRPLQFAQDPNPNPNGTWTWAGYDNIINWDANHSSWFVFNDTASVERGGWAAAAQSSHGLYLYSHFGNMEGIDAVKVARIAPVHNEELSVTAYNISLIGTTDRRNFAVSHGVHFVATDALHLIDQPGEYWIDRDKLLLYYFPLPQAAGLSQSNGSTLFLSIWPSLIDSSIKHPQPLVQMQGVQWLSFVNVTIAVSTQTLMSADGVLGLTIDGCAFHGAGASCVSITNANQTTVRKSSVSHCGGEGIVLTGGNWNKFGPSLFQGVNVSAVENTISDWARWQRVPSVAGICWSGVGLSAVGNVLMDSPEPAVSGNGNAYCIFEDNLINNVNYEQSDMGAFYHGSSAGGYTFGWTQPGNVIRGNRFSNIFFAEQRPSERAWRFPTQAIYMDDEQSAYTIVNNSFRNVDVAVLIGGGREHTVANNTFETCGTACIHIDNRGMNWAHELCGCQCAFNQCVPGCHDSAAVGPGLAANFSAPDGSFRFEQGMALLHCAGTNNPAPPCSTNSELQWLKSVLKSEAGGGACAPANNFFSKNQFPSNNHQKGQPAWQFCGDLHNPSIYDGTCRAVNDSNPADLTVWGSSAVGNTFAGGAGTVELPVMPWPSLDATSPVEFAQWLVNWDIGYYDNSSDLLSALNATDPDIFEWDFGSEDNREHFLTRRGVYVSSHQSYEWCVVLVASFQHQLFSLPLLCHFFLLWCLLWFVVAVLAFCCASARC